MKNIQKNWKKLIAGWPRVTHTSREDERQTWGQGWKTFKKIEKKLIAHWPRVTQKKKYEKNW